MQGCPCALCTLFQIDPCAIFCGGNQREIFGVACYPVRHRQQAGQKHLLRHRRNRQRLHGIAAAFCADPCDPGLPDGFPCVLIAAKISRFFRFDFKRILQIVLRSAMVRPDDCRDANRAFVFLQNHFPRSRMGWLGRFHFAERRNGHQFFFKCASVFGNHFSNSGGKQRRQLAGIMRQSKKPQQGILIFSRRKQNVLRCRRQPVSRQTHHHLCRVFRMDPQRQPIAASLRVAFCRKPGDLFRNSDMCHLHRSFLGILFFRCIMQVKLLRISCRFSSGCACLFCVFLQHLFYHAVSFLVKYFSRRKCRKIVTSGFSRCFHV